MNNWNRYLTAWSRHHRSGGFGIHSPFAYGFVRTVLRERTPYYSYEGIGQLIRTVKAGTTRRQRHAMDMVSEREARLLFRVTNHFNPQRIMQVGLSTGIESIVMLAVNSRSRLWVYDPRIDQKTLALRVLGSQQGRITFLDDPSIAARELLGHHGNGGMALLNTWVDESIAFQLLDAGAVVIVRHLNRDTAMKELFDACRRHMAHGQTFTNGKIALLYPNPKLQREDFKLWL